MGYLTAMAGNPLPLIALAVGAYLLLGKGKGGKVEKWVPTIPPGPVRLLDDQCNRVILDNEQQAILEKYLQVRSAEIVMDTNNLMSMSSSELKDAAFIYANLPDNPSAELLTKISEVDKESTIVTDEGVYMAIDGVEAHEISMVIYGELTPKSCAPVVVLNNQGKVDINFTSPAAKCAYLMTEIGVTEILGRRAGLGDSAMGPTLVPLLESLVECSGVADIADFFGNKYDQFFGPGA